MSENAARQSSVITAPFDGTVTALNLKLGQSVQTGQTLATPFAPSELPANLAQQLLAQAGSNEALYRINVQLDEQSIQAYGEAMALKAGLTLEADVLQERRKVWEWVLEPVLAARAQLKVLGAASKVVSTGS
jgi:multidrug efflux pump subunit AcrA (membrane-fusion protein)